jgi:hypothetical protein
MKKISLTTLLLAAIVLFGILGAFASVMTTMNHNEGMYISASVLVSQNKTIYKDFGFTETPYLPILYGGLFRILNIGSYYLLMGKLISFLSLVLAAMTLFFITRRVSNSIASSLSIAALFLLDMNIVGPAGQVSNYIIPLTLSLVSFYLFEISFDQNETKPFGIAIAGLLLAIAVGIRLMYAAVIIPFVAIILFHVLKNKHSSIEVKRSITHVLLAFAIGVIVGLLPMLFFLSDFQSFYFNNLGFHFTNGYWFQTTGFSRISLLSKLSFLKDIFLQANNLILIIGILVAVGLFFRSFRVNGQTVNRQTMKEMPKGALLAFLLFVIAVPTTLAPTPSFFEYYAMPISFLFLILIYSCVSKSPDISMLLGRLLLILVLVSVVYNGISMVKSIFYLRDRNNWAGLMVHNVSMNIRNALPNYGKGNNGKIATLSPMYVADANLPIYLELADGPFIYRAGDLLTPEQRKHFVVTSPKTIGNLLNEDPPAAIFVGFEGNLDKPLVQYAVSHNYTKVDGSFNGGQLYVLDINKR